jgi:hypothetical protein
MQMPSCYGVTILALIAIGALVCLSIYLHWLARRGGTVRMSQLADGIEVAMSRGLDGSRIALRHPGSKYCVRFEKSIPPHARTTFRMFIESTCCSPEEFARIQDMLRGVSVEYEITRPPRYGCDCIVAEFGPDPEGVAELVRVIFRVGFGLPHDAVLRSFHEGVFNLWPTAPNWIGWEQTKDSDRDLTKRP